MYAKIYNGKKEVELKINAVGRTLYIYTPVGEITITLQDWENGNYAIELDGLGVNSAEEI